MKKKDKKYVIENKEVREYFYRKYEDANFRIVPGHHPNFKSKSEVDQWIKNQENMMQAIEKIGLRGNNHDTKL